MADRKLQKEKERKQAALEARLMQNRLQSLDAAEKAKREERRKANLEYAKELQLSKEEGRRRREEQAKVSREKERLQLQAMDRKLREDEMSREEQHKAKLIVSMTRDLSPERILEPFRDPERERALFLSTLESAESPLNRQLDTSVEATSFRASKTRSVTSDYWRQQHESMVDRKKEEALMKEKVLCSTVTVHSLNLLVVYSI